MGPSAGSCQGLSASLPSQAGTGDGRKSHGSTGEARAVRCSWVLLVPPKNGGQKGNTLTGDRVQKKGIRPENCSLPKHRRFFPNSGKYTNLHLSSSLLGGPGRTGPGIHWASQLRWPGVSPDPALCTQIDLEPYEEPQRPLAPRGRGQLQTPHCHPFHSITSWEGCEPKQSCRGAQFPFPDSPVCPDGVVPLDPASLYGAQPFPALGQPEEA